MADLWMRFAWEPESKRVLIKTLDLLPPVSWATMKEQGTLSNLAFLGTGTGMLMVGSSSTV